MTSKNLSLEERPLLAVSSHILIRDWDAVYCSDRFSPSWEGWGTGGAVRREVLSKQGGRRWSAPCRRLSKDARDPPHPGLGVFGARRSTHLLFSGQFAGTTFPSRPGGGFRPGRVGGVPRSLRSRLPSGFCHLEWGPLPRSGWLSLSWGLALSGEWGRATLARCTLGCHAGDTWVRGLRG